MTKSRIQEKNAEDGNLADACSTSRSYDKVSCMGVGTQLKCAGRDTSWQSSQLTVHGARKGNTIHHVLTRYGTDAGAVPARMSSATTTGLASHHA
jgi:hypothetical protein